MWDLDNNEFFDMSIMGIGTNSFGYNNKEVNKAVYKYCVIKEICALLIVRRSLFSRKIIELHPWAGKIFARSGGEANAIAIRIARAASGRDKVAICGYHGWHDWYLSTNLNNDKFRWSFVKNLRAQGCTKILKDTISPFSYNNF